MSAVKSALPRSSRSPVHLPRQNRTRTVDRRGHHAKAHGQFRDFIPRLDRGMQGFARTRGRDYPAGCACLEPNGDVAGIPVHRRATARAENVSSRRCPRATLAASAASRMVSAGRMATLGSSARWLELFIMRRGLPRRRKVGAFRATKSPKRGQACKKWDHRLLVVRAPRPSDAWWSCQ